MKQISLFNQALTMSSLEISELVESRHDSVKRAIERLANQGVIPHPPTVNFEKINNLGLPTQVKTYVFSGEQGKRDSIVVVAQLCPEFTARIIDRWLQLESQQRPQSALPATISIDKDRYIALLESENTLLKTKPKRKTRAPVPLSPSEKHQILHLAQRGLGNTAIAKQIGRSRSAVRAVVREGGVQ